MKGKKSGRKGFTTDPVHLKSVLKTFGDVPRSLFIYGLETS